MTDTDFPSVEPDMTPPTGRTARELLGGDRTPPGKQPPKSSPSRSSSAKSSGPDWNDIEEQLTITYQFVGSMASMVAPMTAGAIQDNARSTASAWVKAGQQNDRIAKFLTSGSGLAVYMALLTAHMPILIAGYNEFVIGPRIAAQEEQAGGEVRTHNGSPVQEDQTHRVEVVG